MTKRHISLTVTVADGDGMIAGDVAVTYVARNVMIRRGGCPAPFVLSPHICPDPLDVTWLGLRIHRAGPRVIIHGDGFAFFVTPNGPTAKMECKSDGRRIPRHVVRDRCEPAAPPADIPLVKIGPSDEYSTHYTPTLKKDRGGDDHGAVNDKGSTHDTGS